MPFYKKITQILILIFLIPLLFSCSEEGCVEADEFSTESIEINSNPLAYKPTGDKIYGNYTTGEKADWHDTGLRANGKGFLIHFSGYWTALDGNNMNASDLASLPVCNICSKKEGAPNCICGPNQNPEPEKKSDGDPVAGVDCGSTKDQNDPTKCTCTTDSNYGSVTDYGVYHFALNFLKKDGITPQAANDQTNCRFDRGLGAYIGLWGVGGQSTPIRVYQLFSTEEICNITRNSNGKCLDASGKDVTRQVFRSAGDRIFVKDDKNGNDGTDTNPSDDLMHQPNEEVKVVMSDTFYEDNLGKYNAIILRGVGNKEDAGLLEFIVRTFEDTILGKIGESGARENGILEFMYKSIIQDSKIITIVNLSLVLYIMLFGVGQLAGVIEIERKELSGRIIKIGLILTFLNSWSLYNDIVVGFFKNGMDSVIAMIMNLFDSNFEPTSAITVAQMDRASDVSNATRFAYVDIIIKNLMSKAVAKKIFGLFFNSFFGFVYIPVIYFLIFAFIFVMLIAATTYLVNVLKIIFILSLGPVFMVFSLFGRTEHMFKNWLAFLGARALEIVILFAILYPFLIVIDRYFMDLLYYRTCAENKGIGPIKMIVLMSYVDRSLFDWCLSFLKVGALIFIIHQVIEKVASVAGSLISIGGIANKDSASGRGLGQSGFGLASSAMSAALGLAKSGAGYLGQVAATGARYGISGATYVARQSGIADKFNKIGQNIPFRGPRTRLRDIQIDDSIQRAMAQADSKGLIGKERDSYVRSEAMNDLQTQMNANPNKMALLGIDNVTIGRRFDQKLIREPLKQLIKAEAKKLKSQNIVPLGKEMKQQIRENVAAWAEANLYSGASNKTKEYLSNSSFKNMVRREAELSADEAAKAFKNDDAGKERFLKHLKENEAKQERKQRNRDKIWADRTPKLLKKAGVEKIPGLVNKALNTFVPSVVSNKVQAPIINTTLNLPKIEINHHLNPKRAQSDFIRKVDRAENPLKFFSTNKSLNPTKWTKGNNFNPLARVNLVDKHLIKTNKNLEEIKASRQREALVSILKDSIPEGNRDEKNSVDKTKVGKGIEIDLGAKAKDQKTEAKRISERAIFFEQLSDLATQELRNTYENPSKNKVYPENERIQQETLRSFSEDNKTLFEKASRLNYLNDKFKTGNQDPREVLSELIKNQLAEDVTQYKKIVESDNATSRKDEIKNLENSIENLKLGLLANKLDDRLQGRFEEIVYGSKTHVALDTTVESKNTGGESTQNNLTSSSITNTNITSDKKKEFDQREENAIGSLGKKIISDERLNLREIRAFTEARNNLLEKEAAETSINQDVEITSSQTASKTPEAKSQNNSEISQANPDNALAPTPLATLPNVITQSPEEKTPIIAEPGNNSSFSSTPKNDSERKIAAEQKKANNLSKLKESFKEIDRKKNELFNLEKTGTDEMAIKTLKDEISRLEGESAVYQNLIRDAEAEIEKKD